LDKTIHRLGDGLEIVLRVSYDQERSTFEWYLSEVVSSWDAYWSAHPRSLNQEQHEQVTFLVDGAEPL
jgi:hypothetical protein